MPAAWRTYDQFIYAFIALAGTALATWAILWLMHRSRLRPWVDSYAGVVPPFLNVIGVLFGLTLAFLANDTWSAHDRAITAVYKEANAIRSLKVMAAQLPAPHAELVRKRAEDYGSAAAAEWPLLARRESSTTVDLRADLLLSQLTNADITRDVDADLRSLMIRKATEARDERDRRISLSLTHINPLKWMGMAFLGLTTLLSIAVTHIGHPRAAKAALVLFAASAAPTAAIVLVQGNPFQQPTTVSPLPILEVVEATEE